MMTRSPWTCGEISTSGPAQPDRTVAAVFLRDGDDCSSHSVIAMTAGGERRR